jgi:hypothetical protein
MAGGWDLEEEKVDWGLLKREEMSQQQLPELIMGQAAAVLVGRGLPDLAALLLDVESAVIERDPEDNSRDLWLEAHPENCARISDKVEDLRSVAMEIARRRRYPVDWLGVREILPTVGPDWRDQLRAQLDGKRFTNQARKVRVQGPSFVEDGLCFTNAGEAQVYRALKRLQEADLPGAQTIGIFPLPGVRVPGHTWEPDLLVTYRGRAGVLEIDGPHHNGRRAFDLTRDHLLHDAGIALVDRIPVEALADRGELERVLRRFLGLLADTR